MENALKISRDEVEKILDGITIDRTAFPLVLIGIRGYFADGKNRRNVYDDAIVILSDTVCEIFRANTDPSRFGRNAKINKGFAVLKTGVYPSYRFDMHNGSTPHAAICQRVASVTVQRDGGREETGMFGINIHRGGRNTTSSEGCQTLPVREWINFYNLAKQEAVRLWGDAWNRKTVCYILIEKK